jgi:glycine C-acetyltransferase
MDGDKAPLKEIQRLTQKNNGLLMVDEAHGAGVYGPQGQGLAFEEDVRPAIQMGTLGKAMGVSGAYITGEKEIVDLIINKARSFIYTTASPPPVICACMAAIQVVRSEEGADKRKRLTRNCRLFAELIKDNLSIETGGGHINPVVIGDSQKTMGVSEDLLEMGIFAHGIRYPTVAQGAARIRFTLMSEHDESHLRRACDALKNAMNPTGAENARINC